MKDLSVVSYVKREMRKYPFIETMDIYKMLYQSVYLTGHLVNNKLDKVKEYLVNESNVLAKYENQLLYEYISNDVIRINLQPYLKFFNLESLYDKFVKSSDLRYINKVNKSLNELSSIICDASFVENKVLSKLTSMQSVRNILPRHSNIYNKYYEPHYRVCSTDYLDLDMRTVKLLTYLSNLNKGDNKIKIIACEGRCTSGKSTITQAILNNKYNIYSDMSVIHADDFFPNKAKNPNQTRLDFALLGKLLLKIRSSKIGDVISYKAFDCFKGEYYEKTIEVKNVILVEGVYSYDDCLRSYYDGLVFFVVDKKTQMDRLVNRCSNLDLLNKFKNIWIPREEDYYNSYDFILNSNILI